MAKTISGRCTARRSGGSIMTPSPTGEHKHDGDSGHPASLRALKFTRLVADCPTQLQSDRIRPRPREVIAKLHPLNSHRREEAEIQEFNRRRAGRLSACATLPRAHGALPRSGGHGVNLRDGSSECEPALIFRGGSLSRLTSAATRLKLRPRERAASNSLSYLVVVSWSSAFDTPKKVRSSPWLTR